MMTIINIFLSVVLDTYAAINDEQTSKEDKSEPTSDGPELKSSAKVAPMPQTLNLQAKKPDPLGDVGERLREVRQEYGAGSDEYKSVMKEASDLKEEKLREQNAVE